MSYLDFVDWQEASRTFAGLAAYVDTSMNIGVDGHPADHLSGCFLSANAFSVLHERPIVGRDFRPEDDRPGAEPVIIIGHGVWTGRFGADPSTIGRTVRVNGAPATIVGVMPPGFRFPYLAEVWQPLAQMPDIAAQPRDARAIAVFGRLADGVTVEQARAELSGIAAALAARFPATNQGIQGTVVKFTEQFFGSVTEGPPLILMVAVGFVLLIACANAANLLLARAASRAPEISLRRALGASRGRVVRQLVVENLLLAAAAGVCGLLVAWPLTHAIAAETADFNLPYWARITFDGRVFGFVAAICVGTTMLFGLAPAWKLSRGATAEKLREAARTTTGAQPSRRWMSGLQVAEIALSVVLLASAGLLIRSARMAYQTDQLIDGSNVVIARLSLPPGKYATPQERLAFYERLEERLGSVPSIAPAAVGSALPFVGATTRDVALDSDVEPAAAGARRAQTLGIGSAYFETLGLSILRGRSFGPRDGLPGQETVIVNERFVARYLPGQDAIGRRDAFDRQRFTGDLDRLADDRRRRTHNPTQPGQRRKASCLPAVPQPASRDDEADDAEPGQQRRGLVRAARGSANARCRRRAPWHLNARAALAAVALDAACAQLAAGALRSHRDPAVGDRTLRRHRLQHLAADVRDRDTDGVGCSATAGVVAVRQGHARACWPRPHDWRGGRGGDGAGASRCARAGAWAGRDDLRNGRGAAGLGFGDCLSRADMARISAGPGSRPSASLIPVARYAT